MSLALAHQAHMTLGSAMWARRTRTLDKGAASQSHNAKHRLELPCVCRATRPAWQRAQSPIPSMHQGCESEIRCPPAPQARTKYFLFANFLLLFQIQYWPRCTRIWHLPSDVLLLGYSTFCLNSSVRIASLVTGYANPVWLRYTCMYAVTRTRALRWRSELHVVNPRGSLCEYNGRECLKSLLAFRNAQAGRGRRQPPPE